MKTSLGSFFLFVAMQFLCAVRTASMPFSNESLRSTYFFAAAKKSRQKKPLEGNAIHPTITPILQVALSRSRRRTAQSPVPRGVRMAIALLN
jgi:hypothetical protein